MNPRRSIVSFGLMLGLCACSTPAPSVADHEVQELAPFKKTFTGVVMGFDPKGRTLDVSIDMNGIMSIDDDTEDAMKREALADWIKAWKHENPGQHGTLTVRIIDFRGNVVFKETGNV